MPSWNIRVLDSSYRTVNNVLTNELYGRTDDGHSITVVYTGFEPYFYVVEPDSSVIETLEKAYMDRKRLQEHDRNLFLYKSLFLVVISILTALPSYLPTKAWKYQAKANILELYYQQLILHKENSPQWYMLLGELSFEQKKYKEAEAAYKNVLKVQPRNPEALNNLAWLYIKAEDKKFKRPKEALLLSIEAARIRPESHILDTLAECFFENGYVERAVSIEKEALEKADKHRDYYQQQLERFEDALRVQGRQAAVYDASQ